MMVQQQILPKNTKLKQVRFANESCHRVIPIDITEFEPRKDFKDEVFGWYKGVYIAIKKG
jgi:hypothetical protein